MSVTTTVRELRTALRATVPMVDRTGDHAHLECVHLAAGAGLLLATATDRHDA